MPKICVCSLSFMILAFILIGGVVIQDQQNARWESKKQFLSSVCGKNKRTLHQKVKINNEEHNSFLCGDYLVTVSKTKDNSHSFIWWKKQEAQSVSVIKKDDSFYNELVSLRDSN